ncbi:hypothetical protein [Williamsia sterculiae]|uniref:Uncharacterized protein n=1 Tax=Williamsia sterculiae TaxID=1344003 RepID=A0A1N7GGB6_9NOCA|nr:hypothetical protein [Williamsia sterculiae]SIS11556.1 hypothetical protein SAMN05445060_2745 [Williamsia sterculiae]
MTIFPVEIWGTVAAWISAVGTTGSVAAAAGYYIYDKRIEAKSQARHIRIRLEKRDTGFAVAVWNYSDKAIYDLYAESQAKTLEEVVVFGEIIRFDLENRKIKRLGPDQYDEIAESLKHLPFLGRMDMEGRDNSIGPGEKAEFLYTVEMSGAARYYVGFRDSNARAWRLEYSEAMGHTRSHLSKDKLITYEHPTNMALRLHPRKYKKHRDRRKSVRKWVKEQQK